SSPCIRASSRPTRAPSRSGIDCCHLVAFMAVIRLRRRGESRGGSAGRLWLRRAPLVYRQMTEPASSQGDQHLVLIAEANGIRADRSTLAVRRLAGREVECVTVQRADDLA